MRLLAWNSLALITASVLVLSCDSKPKNDWEGRIVGEVVGFEFHGQYDRWANGKFFETKPGTEGERVQWNFGDGTVEVVTSKQVAHVYDAPGQYTIYSRFLRVWEDPFDLPSRPESDTDVVTLVVDVPEDSPSLAAEN